MKNALGFITALTIGIAAATLWYHVRHAPIRPLAVELAFATEPVFRDEGPAWETTLADFDRDGQDDILVNGHVRRMGIRYRRAEGWEKSPFVFRRPADRHGCDAADVDGDGWLDLFCARGALKGAGERDNELWRGIDGVKFEKIAAHGAELPAGRGRMARFFHYDGDERPDLYVTNFRGGEGETPGPGNQVFVNRDGRFVAETNALLTDGRGADCLDMADVNADGIDDLVFCGDIDRPVLLLSFGPKRYRAVALDLGKGPLGWVDTRFGDLDGDGRPDLVASTGADEVLVFINRGGSNPLSRHKTIQVAETVPGTGSLTTAVAMADIDGDGHRDLYVARRLGRYPHEQKTDLPDRVLLGPDWQRYALPPDPLLGISNRVYAWNERFLVLNAGHNWSGSLEIVSLRTPASTH